MSITEPKPFTVKAMAKHLTKTDGHLGRDGVEANALAKHMGLSIHTIQSVAKGRRNFSDRQLEKVGRWVARRG